MNHLEKTIKEFDEKYFVAGKNALGYEVPLLFPAKSEIREFLIKSHIKYLNDERKRIVMAIEKERFLNQDKVESLMEQEEHLQSQLSKAEQLLGNQG